MFACILWHIYACKYIVVWHIYVFMYIVIWHIDVSCIQFYDICLYMKNSSSLLGITCMFYDRLHCTNIYLNGLALLFLRRFLDGKVVGHLLCLVNGCSFHPWMSVYMWEWFLSLGRCE